MNFDNKRERALEIVDYYCYLHGGTAIAAGYLGGQFGADTGALSVLTAAMINSICEVYGIEDKAAKAVHIGRAWVRLTAKGTALARTILNWVPIGPIANGATSFFLTRSAGKQCIDEIEKEKMSVSSQLKLGVQDVAVTVLKGSIGDVIIESTDGITNETIDKVNQLLDNDLSHSIGIEKIIESIESIPTVAEVGIDKAIGVSLKNGLIACVKGDTKQIGSPEMLRDLIFKTVSSMIDEEVRLSEREIQFRMMTKDQRFSAFNEFLQTTSKHYDELDKERGTLESIRYVMSALSDGMKIHFGLSSQDMLSKIMDNPYDKSIESEYKMFIPIIEDSSSMETLLSKASILYYRLITINYVYRLPNVSFEKIDDRLSHLIAGRIRKAFKSFDTKSNDYLSYMLSEYVREHSSYLTHRFVTPIFSIDQNIREMEYEDNLKRAIAFWCKAAHNAMNDTDLWSIGYMLYIQLFRIERLKKGEYDSLYKDDNLVYRTAEIVKEKKFNTTLTDKFSIEQIAYFISEYYDKHCS